MPGVNGADRFADSMFKGTMFCLDPAPAPSWLIDWARRLGEQARSNVKATRQSDDGSEIPEGRRDLTLASLAGTMRARGMSPASIEAALLSENELRCTPPLPASVVQKIARSISSYQPDVFAGVTIILSNEAAPKPSADTSDDPLDDDATAHDLILNNAVVNWAWPKWIPLGVLTILASEPGVGKTRFCADLARRVYHGLCWPDGAPATFPKGSPVLWVPADNQHPEIGSLPTEFGFPATSLYLNATKRNPFGGTMLDTAEDLKDFEARIARVRPVLVFVDTCLNATDRTSHKPEDAKAFFKPLQEIAQRQGVALVCVTHLNAAGKPLGRRVMGQGRVVIQLEKPDEDPQSKRRRLFVVKSNSLFPSPLGVTMGDAGNEYDDTPPEAAKKASRSEADDPQLAACIQWLYKHLKGGAQRVCNTRKAATAAGFGPGTLYRAKQAAGIEEYKSEGYLEWVLPSNPYDQ